MAGDACTDQVGGEPRELLRRAIACMTMTKGLGGEAILSGKLPHELSEPLSRALMRIEAELLLHDADLFTVQRGEIRTQSERRADSFTTMLQRLVD
ncbi:hypothetical protein [Mycolicibacterium austroafricanum]|uniref:hypothetical protein n=1 Tax=Mycolicibacterium austroafricanum TaxID=39687 RepID=UPI000CF88AB8|nr:hypothetical protein [Mycolicibacterium austroafricanum]PQP40008.1 hypothetical protein C6A88_32070 [Mycolicibacterium austroafricanum]